MRNPFKSLSDMFSKDPAGTYIFLFTNFALLCLACLPILLLSFSGSGLAIPFDEHISYSDSMVFIGNGALSLFLMVLCHIFVRPIQYGFFIGMAKTGNAVESLKLCFGNYGRLLGVNCIQLLADATASFMISTVLYFALSIPFIMMAAISQSLLVFIIVGGIFVLLIYGAIVYFIDSTSLMAMFDAVLTKETVVNTIEKTIKHGQVARTPIFVILCCVQIVFLVIFGVPAFFLYQYTYILIGLVLLMIVVVPPTVVGLSYPYYLKYRDVVDAQPVVANQTQTPASTNVQNQTTP